MLTLFLIDVIFFLSIKGRLLQMINNRVTIAGVVESNFILDHDYYSERFYQFMLGVKRTSGTMDSIPVIVSERLIDVSKDLTGQYVSIVGEFRSFNLHDMGKVRLLLYVFPQKIELLDEPDNQNDILIQATICKEPVIRETPYGRVITDVLLAINREYNKSDYIPAIAWGRNAIYISTLHSGSVIRATGRVQSRNYNKGGVVKTAYELSINLVETVS